jgi:hypothetical protein
MNTAVATTRADYLDRVAAGLADLPDDDREEVLQDLRAHLAELDEGDIVTTLGSPEAFVAEFRQSAGLEEKPGRRTRHRIRSTRAKLDVFERRLAEMTHWSTTRQLWIWTRGWLLVSTYAVLTGGTAFRRFPIPVVEDQTAVGLALVATATWLSVWLDVRQTTPRQAASFVYSTSAVFLVMVSLLSVVDLSVMWSRSPTTPTS